TTENRARVVPETTASKPGDTTATSGDSTPAGGAASAATSTSGAAKDSVANTGGQAVAKPAATTPVPPAVSPAPIVGRDPVPVAGQSLYHFVILRTESKNHALRRYNQLLGYQLNIRLETKDSTFFKLYFPIAAAIRDTAHIRDSLADVYAAKISIESH
ncbi:MAG TPA: hypothetical protein VKQ52_11380, partial [Puia sp.]|nr:hypothetical protein [Puia sp.]